jgi:hypothetical protein
MRGCSLSMLLYKGCRDDAHSPVKHVQTPLFAVSDNYNRINEVSNPDLICILFLRFLTTPIFHSFLQLKQGRPVQREAVLAGGAGDYSSMMYGDKEAPQGTVTPLSEPATAVVKEKVEKEIEKGKVIVVEAVAPAAASSAPAAAPIGQCLSSPPPMFSCYFVLLPVRHCPELFFSKTTYTSNLSTASTDSIPHTLTLYHPILSCP